MVQCAIYLVNRLPWHPFLVRFVVDFFFFFEVDLQTDNSMDDQL